MTVKELRDITRRMGVSVEGNKKDLVSAIMDSLVDEENGKEGKSRTEQVNPSEVPSKQKVQGDGSKAGLDVNDGTEPWTVLVH